MEEGWRVCLVHGGPARDGGGVVDAAEAVRRVAALAAAVVALRTVTTRPVVRTVSCLRLTTPVRFMAAGIPSIQDSILVTYSVMH